MMVATVNQDSGCDIALGMRQQGGVSALPCTTLTLPMPPSVNNLFKTLPGGGRGKTRDYKKWTLEAAVELKLQKPARVPGRVLITIACERESEASDIDNRIKALLDLLVQPGLKREDRAHGVIDDDRYVTGLAISWAPRGRGRAPRARVAIMPVAEVTAVFHPTADGATGGWFLDALHGEE